ncbi:hypothetical protein [Mucilaginibacter paludis]|uniref:Uncharacterized protein n=1 Tax=Mucilaginibacter paludis DSM 18603 TaxID=714943 RepID=H1XZ47_9SPHI|nr:hypothetical protein [Mucilaginibacter paludis]EHQ24632.1 hypothetical protein Mucpa_0438 [Mucilaginibacter paludis DSM 18603]
MKQQKTLSPKAAALAERIANSIIRRQTKLADSLNRRTQHWNRASKTVALLVFCILFGGLCFYLIIKSF